MEDLQDMKTFFSLFVVIRLEYTFLLGLRLMVFIGLGFYSFK